MASDTKRAAALAALLESSTLTEAAEKARISRKTLYNYLRDDKELALAYQAAQEQLALEQMDALANDRERAKATILALMEDERQPAAIRLKAAQSIFEIAEAQQERVGRIANYNATKDIFGDLF